MSYSNEHNQHSLIDGLPCPDQECFEVEGAAFLDGLVEGWESFNLALRDIFVENEGEDGETRVNSRVTKDQISVVNGDCDEEVEAGEYSLDERNNHATMHDELTECGRSLVRQSTVPYDKLFDVAEPDD